MKISRRRFLSLSASALGVVSLPVVSKASMLKSVTWEGQALGATATMRLLHESEAIANKALEECVALIHHLESQFSLYREDSTLCQLNRDGLITQPSREFVALMESSLDIAQKSRGLFDITIQPLWRLYHEHFKRADAAENVPDEGDIVDALRYVDYRKVELTDKQIRLPAGMAITFNGIAQGYITDQVRHLLMSHGFDHALINVGEYAALGHKAHGGAWQIGISNPSKPWQIIKKCELTSGRAMATSGAYGTRWSAYAHHMLSPITGNPARVDHASVSVMANSAMLADGISTYASLLPKQEAMDRISESFTDLELTFL